MSTTSKFLSHIFPTSLVIESWKATGRITSLFLKVLAKPSLTSYPLYSREDGINLKIDDNRTFCKLIKNKFTTKVLAPNKSKKTFNSLPSKLVNFSKLLPPQLFPRPSKEVSAKLEFHRKNAFSKITETLKLSYAQISLKSIDIILKIKENFLKLSHKKIEQINKLIFNILDKLKLRINITTKGPSWKQIIIPISSNNANKIIVDSDEYIANLNHFFKNTKSGLSIDFIWVDHQGLIVTSNRVTSLPDISIISKYIKSCNDINTNDIQDVWLTQSKLYLKILGILYIKEDTDMSINSEVMKTVIKSTHIFNNVNIASKPYIVKVSSKSNMVIV